MAIPSNSNSWPFCHRDEADKLIRQRCPNGYEIVSEQEVVVGQRAFTDTKTDTKEAPTLMIGDKSSTSKQNQAKTKKGNTTTTTQDTTFAGLAVPVGEATQTTHQTTTYSDVSEYRIEYRAK